MKYFLGLDIGTTAVKAAVFDENGFMRGDGLAEYTLETPAPDIVEIDAEKYFDASKSAMAQALNSAGITEKHLTSVGVTGQAETIICTDAAGNPLRKAVVWLDNRAKVEAGEFTNHFGNEYLHQISGQTEMLPCWSAAKHRWLHRHEPQLLEKTAMIMLPEDYVIYKLTGKFVTCRGLMPSSLCYDIRSGNYDPALLDFAHIRAEQLPHLIDPGECAGFWHNAAVTSCPIDHVCGLLGSGGGSGVVTAATGCTFAACAALDKLTYDDEKRLSTYHGYTPGSYVFLPWAPTAGMLLRRFRDEFAAGMSYAELDEAASAVAPGSDGLILLPHCAGAVSPVCNPAARGAAWGFTLSHTRAHFARAIMESVAFLLRDNFEMLKSLGVPVNEIRMLGGASHSPLWRQIQADILNTPVAVPECSEAVAMGAAILGAVAAEEFADPVSGAEQWVRTKCVVIPSDDAAEYQKLFADYQRINELLLPTWK